MNGEELDYLREMTEVPERDVLLLRERVLARTRRPWWLPWAWVPAVPALLAFVVALWPQPVELFTLPMPSPPVAPAVALSKPAAVEQRAVAVRPKPNGAAVIQIETPDPNVVIYIVNSDGGAE
ncbi:MAG: hypothetical protein U0Q16_01995 [Bryobacteraceae bacterium]